MGLLQDVRAERELKTWSGPIPEGIKVSREGA